MISSKFFRSSAAAIASAALIATGAAPAAFAQESTTIETPAPSETPAPEETTAPTEPVETPAPDETETTAPSEQDAGRFFVRFVDMPEADQEHKMQLINEITKEFGSESTMLTESVNNSYVIRLDPPVPADQIPALTSAFESAAEIEYAEVDRIVRFDPPKMKYLDDEETETPAPTEPAETPAPSETPAPTEVTEVAEADEQDNQPGVNLFSS